MRVPSYVMNMENTTSRISVVPAHENDTMIVAVRPCFMLNSEATNWPPSMFGDRLSADSVLNVSADYNKILSPGVRVVCVD